MPETSYTVLPDHEERSSGSQEEQCPFLDNDCKHPTPRGASMRQSIVFLILLSSCSIIGNLVKYSTIHFNGSFSGENVYRGPPGPEVDEAWRALGTDNRHYVVPEHLGLHYGLDPGHTKRPDSRGGGFPVNLEFERHLHRLNLLRQSSYWNFDYYLTLGEGPSAKSEKVLEGHIGHCLGILRQVIMCTPDTGVFGSYWTKATGQPFVDCNTKHKCKNFDELSDWVMEHQISQDEFDHGKVVQRPGDVVLPNIP